IHRDAGLSALIESDTVDVLADGLDFTEGPLWLPDGSTLIQDIKAEITYQIHPDGTLGALRKQTKAANGQTFDALGRIVFCEQNGRRVSRMAPDGSAVETVVETWQGKRLNSPNDVICRSDGLTIFTDPPYGLPSPEAREIPFQGVYSIDRSDVLRLLVSEDFEKPNGLAFSPDERTLYVCDTGKYHVRAFRINAEGSVEPGSDRVFATMDPAEPGGPDGLKVDRDGRLYVAVAEGIWVYEPDGRLLGILALRKRPANLAWADSDSRGLVITARETVYRVRLKVAGIMPPFFQPKV
ncbi:MAG: SMP-30/gluconolactonase/LRE family protein, partial [Isosphaeraceae bacterium]